MRNEKQYRRLVICYKFLGQFTRFIHKGTKKKRQTLLKSKVRVCKAENTIVNLFLNFVALLSAKTLKKHTHTHARTVLVLCCICFSFSLFCDL